MHRTIEISVPALSSDELIARLRDVEGVIGLARNVGASLIPAGDVITVHALNRGADGVMGTVAAVCGSVAFTVVTAEVASISDRAHQKAIDGDVDEAIWEELETGLRHQGRLTGNFLLLMALGGVIGAAGALTEPAVAAVAYVASAIIAPGFEPLAKLPLGLILRRWEVLWSGLVSSVVGYAVLIAAAGMTWLLLYRFGSIPASMFLEGDALKHTLHPTSDIVTIAAAGALAGVIIEASYRRSVIAGALVAMRLIEAAAVAGIAIAMGRLDLAAGSLYRLAIDVGLVIAAGLLVFGFKQLVVHRRAPLH